MIDPNHLYCLHTTYSGPGCAICGKSAESHSQEFWMVNGKQTKPEDAFPPEKIRPKSLIETIMDEAGVTKECYEWPHQWNLTYASLSDFGIRCGLDPRIKKVMEEKGLGKMTEKGKREWIAFLMRIRYMLGSSSIEGATRSEREG